MVAPAITGSSEELENVLGPVHEYTAPPMVFAFRLTSFPAQTGFTVTETVGAAGLAVTVTDTIPAGPIHPLTVSVTE